MNINCNIAEDLLPLYLDESCSEDSRAVLEAHLKECPSCAAKLDRMRSGITDDIQVEKSTPNLTNYAKKVRRHRIRIAVLAVLVTVIASAVLALVYLTISDMRRQSSPHVYEVETGTYNLTSGSLETTAEDVGQYVFYTNYTQIKVTVEGSGGIQGTVMLWNTTNSDSFIQIADVNEKTDSCTFKNLSASIRYKVTCDNLDGAKITVSEGRTVSFWSSLKAVLSDIVK